MGMGGRGLGRVGCISVGQRDKTKERERKKRDYLTRLDGHLCPVAENVPSAQAGMLLLIWVVELRLLLLQRRFFFSVLGGRNMGYGD